MISYYQPHLLPFLSSKHSSVPKNIKRLYYLSWEDALWDILPQLGAKHGDTILIPDFYCFDVIKNMKLHGYKAAYYPLDHNLQISRSSFTSIYNKIKPTVVILFDACGIKCNLSKDESLMKKILKHSVVIEDQVQRIIDPSKIKILQGRHLIMDSLRKNLPLPGSFVYTSSETGSLLSSPTLKSPIYTLKTITLYFLYRTTLSLGVLLHNPPLVKYAHKNLLSKHDDLIGDSIPGNPGIFWIPLIHRFIDYSKIRHLKKQQVRIYEDLLHRFIKSASFVSLPKIDDKGELHAFPLVIDSRYAAKVERYLLPFNVWSKFSDSVWSKNKRIFYLPLGFHITLKDQQQIVKTIIESCQKSV